MATEFEGQGVEEKIAKILLDIQAVTVNTAAPYKYSSGLYSPVYVDCRLISSFTNERRIMLNSFFEIFENNEKYSDVDIIIGSGHSGISLATFVSERLSLPMAYVRTAAKDHGKKKLIEGIVESGQKALIITDIFGTEKHIENSVKSLKEEGVNIVGVYSVFNLELGNIEEFLQKENIFYQSLTSLQTLLKVASQKNVISSVEIKEIKNWLTSPQAWGVEHERKVEKDVESIKSKTAKRLLEVKAVSIDLNNPFHYASGIISPIYTDNRLWMNYPIQWKELIQSMASLIINNIGLSNFDVIAGTSTAGISHAAYLADTLNMPLIYIKSKAEGHGKYNKVEGIIKPGQRVLVVEDLISTGGSSLQCVEAVRENGGIVEMCIAIFTYELQSSVKGFKEHKVELITATNFTALVKQAVKNGYLDKSGQELVLTWKNNPETWGK